MASEAAATTWPEFKQLASAFHETLPAATAEEADAGFARLELAYRGLDCGHLHRLSAEGVMHYTAAVLRERGRAALVAPASNGYASSHLGETPASTANFTTRAAA